MKVIIGLVSVAIVALVATVIFLAPLMTVTYYEDEPLSYHEIDSFANLDFDFSLGVYVECFVLIENTDTVPGTFAVNFIVTTPNRTFADNDRAYILPGEVKTLKGVADIDMGEEEDWELNRNITPGTKSVAHQKKVTLLEYMTDY